MRSTHRTVLAGATLGLGVALAVIGLRASGEHAIHPNRIPATGVPLPVQRGVVPLDPAPEPAPNKPHIHRATSTELEALS